MREAREALGLSQAALAARSGVSRALVSACETGRHRPGVDVALALAHALDRPVEALFGSAPHAAEDVGAPVVAGDLVRCARVGGRVVRVRAAPADAAERARADAVVGEDDRAGRLSGGGAPDGVVVAGCDPALRLASLLAPPSGPRRIVDVAATSDEARRLLRARRVHAALVHGARPVPRAAERTLHRVRVGAWRVGLAVAPGGPREVGDVLAASGPFVRRSDTAAVQQAVERAATGHGLPVPAGPVAAGHLAVAAHVALAGGAGVANEPAARAAGLGFAPVERHRVELWIAPAAAALPGVDELLRLLVDPGLRARLPGADAYDTDRAGDVLAATA